MKCNTSCDSQKLRRKKKETVQKYWRKWDVLWRFSTLFLSRCVRDLLVWWTWEPSLFSKTKVKQNPQRDFYLTSSTAATLKVIESEASLVSFSAYHPVVQRVIKNLLILMWMCLKSRLNNKIHSVRYSSFESSEKRACPIFISSE